MLRITWPQRTESDTKCHRIGCFIEIETYIENIAFTRMIYWTVRQCGRCLRLEHMHYAALKNEWQSWHENIKLVSFLMLSLLTSDYYFSWMLGISSSPKICLMDGVYMFFCDVSYLLWNFSSPVGMGVPLPWLTFNDRSGIALDGNRKLFFKQTLFIIPHSTDNADILNIKIQTFRSQSTFVSITNQLLKTHIPYFKYTQLKWSNLARDTQKTVHCGKMTCLIFVC